MEKHKNEDICDEIHFTGEFIKERSELRAPSKNNAYSHANTNRFGPSGYHGSTWSSSSFSEAAAEFLEGGGACRPGVSVSGTGTGPGSAGVL
jgi:hypothetical protein